jgi:PAS domain S-box-containing protein
VKEESGIMAAGPANPMSHSVREEVLLSLVRNSMDAIVSADGVIDYWNPAAEKLYGYTAAEAIGKPATLIVPPDKLDEFEKMKGRLERGERIEQFSTQRLKKDGTLVEVELTVFPVMDSDGRLAATSVISHDITEHLRLQKEVEQIAGLKADFLAKMSHEIRTPLNAIIGTAELQMLSEMTPGTLVDLFFHCHPEGRPAYASGGEPPLKGTYAKRFSGSEMRGTTPPARDIVRRLPLGRHFARNAKSERTPTMRRKVSESSL